jgi:phosphoribosylformimino-5-aminoimidazole carboxamide ribotide isomerase
MNIIPVLDLMNHQVVHAIEGNRHRYLPIESCLTTSTDPIAVTEALLALYPFKVLYIADINAIQNNGDHKKTIHELALHFPALEIWLDCGFDNEATIRSWETPNIRLVLGTESLSNTQQYQRLLKACISKPILSLDFKNNKLQGPVELINEFNLWTNDVIVMTLDKVGSNNGPDIQQLNAVNHQSNQAKIYAAGGVRNIEDIQLLESLNIEGALIASALHNGAISNKELQMFQT